MFTVDAIKMNTRILRIYIGSILFLLAGMVCLSAGGYYYLDEAYPSDPEFLQPDSARVLSFFQTVEARKAGYTDAQIRAFLADKNRAEFRRRFRWLLLSEGSLLLIAVLAGGGVVILYPLRASDR
jgi:hypothetical protein